MSPRDFGHIPPPLPPEVEALLEHERVLESQPEIVRARLMVKARELTRLPPSYLPAVSHRVSPWRPRWFVAGAGLVLATSVAVAVQLGRHVPATETTHPVASSHALSAAIPAREIIPSFPPDAPGFESEANSSDQPSPFGSSTSKSGRVVEELRLMERARRADSRREHLAVLSAVAAHERRFPHGRLSEEREILRVHALVALGRSRDARSYVATFHRKFPRSVLARKIDELLANLR